MPPIADSSPGAGLGRAHRTAVPGGQPGTPAPRPPTHDEAGRVSATWRAEALSAAGSSSSALPPTGRRAPRPPSPAASRRPAARGPAAESPARILRGTKVKGSARSWAADQSAEVGLPRSASSITGWTAARLPAVRRRAGVDQTPAGVEEGPEQRAAPAPAEGLGGSAECDDLPGAGGGRLRAPARRSPASASEEFTEQASLNGAGAPPRPRRGCAPAAWASCWKDSRVRSRSLAIFSFAAAFTARVVSSQRRDERRRQRAP